MKQYNYYGEKACEDVVTGTNMNAFDFMDNATKTIGDYTSMTYFESKITYDELKRNIYLYANKLKAYGLEMGDTISLCMPNVPEMVYYKYAAWLLGIKTNLIDPRFNPMGIKASVNDSKSNLLITVVDAYLPKIVPIIDGLNVDNIVLVTPADSIDLNQSKSLINVLAKVKYNYNEFFLKIKDENIKKQKVLFNDKFLKNTANSKLPSVYIENMDATIVFTSGTTGKPKGAVLTHDGYNIKVKQIIHAVTLNPGDHFLAAIPFFSAYGSFAGMHDSLVRGVNMFMIPNFKPNQFPELVCKYRCNTSIGVPKYWEDFIKEFPNIQKKYNIDDLSFIMNAVSGGDKFPYDSLMRVNEFLKSNNSQANVTVGYGSSETGGPISITVDKEGVYEPESTGLLFPGVKCLFADPETHEINEELTEGELFIHDPAMMSRYLDDEEDTNKITEYYDSEKYYNMGDLFKLENNQLYFKGRTKRAIMRPDGHTVHASPIEDAIISHPLVDNVCVVGLKKADNSAGAIPTAFIILKKGVTPTNELVKDIDDLSLSLLSERNRALVYTFVNELPYTLMAKVDYRKLEELKIEDIDSYIVDYTFFEKDKYVRIKR